MVWAQAVSCPQVCSCAYIGSSREVCNWGANMSGILKQYFCCKNKVPNISGSQLLSEYEKTMNYLLKQICVCACAYIHTWLHTFPEFHRPRDLRTWLNDLMDRHTASDKCGQIPQGRQLMVQFLWLYIGFWMWSRRLCKEFVSLNEMS